ncbi:hypothetical protein [Nitrosomonas communis]|nr:hypothetical protein [Nitrosomonas communis]
MNRQILIITQSDMSLKLCPEPEKSTHSTQHPKQHQHNKALGGQPISWV